MGRGAPLHANGSCKERQGASSSPSLTHTLPLLAFETHVMPRCNLTLREYDRTRHGRGPACQGYPCLSSSVAARVGVRAVVLVQKPRLCRTEPAVLLHAEESRRRCTREDASCDTVMRTMEREDSTLHPRRSTAVDVYPTASVSASEIDGATDSRRRCITLPLARTLRSALTRSVEEADESLCTHGIAGGFWPLALPLNHRRSSSPRLLPADAKVSAEARWLQRAAWLMSAVNTTTQAHLVAAIAASVRRETDCGAPVAFVPRLLLYVRRGGARNAGGKMGSRCQDSSSGGRHRRWVLKADVQSGYSGHHSY